MSDSASPSTTASVSYSNLILAIILVSYTMIVIDNSVVITGLLKIKTQLAFTSAGLSWVSSAYALTFGGLLLLCARAGDILGRRHLLVAGLALFTLSSLCIGLAPTAEWLMVTREHALFHCMRRRVVFRPVSD
ncbi:hypothetical protein Q3404_09690 [Pantoea phytobeneficialis]|uniref:Major facilitator superfamily (MFS) profile domain-containing protein n=1 Tax=Pantoea phytobeneficialis TaxID=2052056 RepID=A0ABT8XVB9_9GAMM|nr:MFS transporter [Pantoea phytobeneficialis]MDO6406850.1 hypothetical protein [Pantoea phytobeneficialis]